jgi:(2Fe-2S) ferredoxin
MESSEAAAFDKIGLSSARRHVFLCLGPDCCAPEEGQVVWDYLKRRLAELQIPALRTKAGCFRICRGGPWMVVYPEGIWYGGVTTDRCERIVAEHLRENRPIEEWIVRRQPLPPPS